MTPEERRAARQAKILARTNLTDDQLASAMMNDKVTELVENPKQVSAEVSHGNLNSEAEPLQRHVTRQSPEQPTPESDPQTISKYLSQKRKFKKFQNSKALLLCLAGIFISLFAGNSDFISKSNLFLLFIASDIAVNLLVSRGPVQVDRDVYSPALSGFITALEKLV